MQLSCGCLTEEVQRGPRAGNAAVLRLPHRGGPAGPVSRQCSCPAVASPRRSSGAGKAGNAAGLRLPHRGGPAGPPKKEIVFVLPEKEDQTSEGPAGPVSRQCSCPAVGSPRRSSGASEPAMQLACGCLTEEVQRGQSSGAGKAGNAAALRLPHRGGPAGPASRQCSCPAVASPRRSNGAGKAGNAAGLWLPNRGGPAGPVSRQYSWPAVASPRRSSGAGEPAIQLSCGCHTKEVQRGRSSGASEPAMQLACGCLTEEVQPAGEPAMQLACGCLTEEVQRGQ
ncbi:collagen alpha-2(I) chain-like [Bacillus rossius redtenbacheri]|uniref:collagen alpha-2(I) chain-like n=1 Tax=Bacillus rossius redtenbacheri TaxID=93214 RepID=UPI002FDD221C